MIPAAHIFAGRGLAAHLPEWLQQTVFAQFHQDGMSFAKLLGVQFAGDSDVGVIELFERLLWLGGKGAGNPHMRGDQRGCSDGSVTQKFTAGRS